MSQNRSATERPPAETGLRRKAAFLASLFALVALLVGALFGDRGLLQLFDQQGKAAALEREIQALRGDNLRLAAEIAALRSDPRAIERLAREQLALAREGETVFLIRSEGEGSRP